MSKGGSNTALRNRDLVFIIFRESWKTKRNFGITASLTGEEKFTNLQATSRGGIKDVWKR